MHTQAFFQYLFFLIKIRDEDNFWNCHDGYTTKNTLSIIVTCANDTATALVCWRGMADIPCLEKLRASSRKWMLTRSQSDLVGKWKGGQGALSVFARLKAAMTKRWNKFSISAQWMAPEILTSEGAGLYLPTETPCRRGGEMRRTLG